MLNDRDTLRIEWTRFQSYMHEKLSLQKHAMGQQEIRITLNWYIAFHTKITTACVNAKIKKKEFLRNYWWGYSPASPLRTAVPVKIGVFLKVT